MVPFSMTLSDLQPRFQDTGNDISQRQITRKCSKTDRSIFTMADQQELVSNLSHAATSNDLE